MGEVPASVLKKGDKRFSRSSVIFKDVGNDNGGGDEIHTTMPSVWRARYIQDRLVHPTGNVITHVQVYILEIVVVAIDGVLRVAHATGANIDTRFTAGASLSI